MKPVRLKTYSKGARWHNHEHPITPITTFRSIAKFTNVTLVTMNMLSISKYTQAKIRGNPSAAANHCKYVSSITVLQISSDGLDSHNGDRARKHR